jgi:hypothetical protein
LPDFSIKQEEPINATIYNDLEVQRMWKKFQQLLTLPEKDQRAVMRLVNSLVGAKGE